MVDLTTTYLGKALKSPLVASASPLSEKLENIKHMEDAGAAAVVFFSLFEEQIRREQEALFYHTTAGTESFAEALTYFPEEPQMHVGADAYLDLIRRAKEAVDIPVIASLNGTSIGGWTKFATRMEEAGADAIELNIYDIPTNMDRSSADIEQTYLDILAAVKGAVNIPVAIKLSPYFSNMANMAKRFDEAGADALVLFNRFYQPDIDLEDLEIVPNVVLSSPQAPQALRLPLTWIGILYGRVKAELAATSGIHSAADALKMLMVGANVTMMTSALLKNGIDHISTVRDDLVRWLDENEYDSVKQMQGSLSQINSPDPRAFERAQYMRALKTYHVTY